MKIKKQLQAICAGFGVSGKGYQATWEEAQALGIVHSVGAVSRDFEAWMTENQGDDFPYGAVSAYLQVASSRLSGPTAPLGASIRDSEVVSLARELSYASGGLISFMDKQRVRLAEVLKDFTAAEIKAAFTSWLADQDTNNPKNVTFLAGKFVQMADGLAYATRRRKQESDKLQIARDALARKLQDDAEAERQKAAQKEKNEAFDPFA
jgi:hypothetical protein